MSDTLLTANEFAATLPPIPAPPRPKPVTIADIPHFWDGQVLLTSVVGAAALMGVSVQTMRKWHRKGWIVVKYTASRRARVVVASLWRDGVPAEVRIALEHAADAARVAATVDGAE